MKKVALVTGAARGIGLGIATSLAVDGCDIAVCDIHEEAAVAAALDGLRQAGADVLYCRADVTDAAARNAMLADIGKRFGRLNVLVNNAGVAPNVRADLLDASEESYERVMKINLQGPYFLTQAAARWMVERKKASGDFEGCIVNISSVSAVVASVNRGEYCISKAGISMATKLWAARLGEFDIPVYEVQPGVITTDMTAGVREKYDKLIGEGLMIQPRWGLPRDIGKAVAMLVRKDLPYSTGQVILVDGGMTIQRL
jgi:NAD(P)-dependent dehydrogenase (short-subunit alcohol dehydrogenase family)